MKILIIGASSYTGGRLYVDLKKKYEVVGTYNANKLFPELLKLDITNAEEVIRVIGEEKPDWIVHVAANPNARWCDAHPKEAIELNELGTKNIVEAADKTGASIIYISSTAALKPVDVYRKTKLAGEKIVREAKNGFDILQPSLIIGLSPNTTNDRPFNRLLKNITEKTPAVYDTSWKAHPTWVGHISEVIDLIIEGNITDETIPIAVPELKNRYEIAKDILSPFNITVAPEDKNDKTPVTEVTQEKLKELNLPTYTYDQIVERIVKETKDNLFGD